MVHSFFNLPIRLLALSVPGCQLQGPGCNSRWSRWAGTPHLRFLPDNFELQERPRTLSQQAGAYSSVNRASTCVFKSALPLRFKLLPLFFFFSSSITASTLSFSTSHSFADLFWGLECHRHCTFYLGSIDIGVVNIHISAINKQLFSFCTHFLFFFHLCGFVLNFRFTAPRSSSSLISSTFTMFSDKTIALVVPLLLATSQASVVSHAKFFFFLFFCRPTQFSYSIF